MNFFEQKLCYDTDTNNDAIQQIQSLNCISVCNKHAAETIKENATSRKLYSKPPLYNIIRLEQLYFRFEDENSAQLHII